MRIVFIENEPSPYMDVWFKSISQKYDLTVIYSDEVNKGHPWGNFKGYNGFFSKKITLNDLRRIVKNGDMVIAAGWVRLYSMMSMLFGFYYHKKTIMTTDYPFHSKPIFDFFKRYFLYKRLDYIFCATRTTVSLLEKNFGDIVEGKLKFFPYGIETKTALRQNVDANKKEISILVATNFLPRKGHKVLMEALKELDKTEDAHNYCFTFIGQGETLGECKEIASHLKIKTQFLGWVENDIYKKLLDETDVYIHPSIEEPFGIPPVDAMCRGKVVIVCDGVMSLNGLIKQGVNGYRYSSPINNPNASLELFEILKNLDRSSFNSIGVKAHDDAVRYFSMDQYVDMIDTL